MSVCAKLRGARGTNGRKAEAWEILAADVVGFSRLTAVDDRCAQIAVIPGPRGEQVD